MAIGTGTEDDPRHYDVATETADNSVYSDLLIQEIEAASVAPTLVNIGTQGGPIERGAITGGTCDISFASEPSAGDLVTLDSVVLAHVGSNPPRRLWRRWEVNAMQENLAPGGLDSAVSQVLMPVHKGVYRVSWNMEMRLQSVGPLNSQCLARVRLNGNVIGVNGNPTETWSRQGGWDFFNTDKIGEQPTMEILFGRDPDLGGNDTVQIRNVKISIEQMS